MSPRIEQFLSWFFFLIGGVLAAVGFVGLLAPAPGPDLLIEATELEIADAAPESPRDVVFQLNNRSDKPMRILGLSEC